MPPSASAKFHALPPYKSFSILILVYYTKIFLARSVPPSPTDLSVKPQYSVTGNVKYVDVGFTGVVSLQNS